MAAGCSEPPSFELRWSIAESFELLGDARTPESQAECTARGIDGVRVVTTQGGLTIDSREFDCFVDGLAPGPTLEAGRYLVEVMGLRRTQTPWSCQLDSTYIGDPNCTGGLGCACDEEGLCDEGLSCASQLQSTADGVEILGRFCEACTARSSFVIEIGGERPELDAPLISPLECDDGIDNDGDGLTDSLDPACARDPSRGESSDLDDTTIALQVSFLGGNNAADCIPGTNQAAPLGVSTIRTRLTGNGVDEVRDDICQRALPLQLFELAPGDYQVEVTGMGNDGAGGLEARTLSETLDLSVGELGGFLAATVDFAGEEFLEPVTGTVGGLPRFVFEVPGASTMARGCSPSNNSSSPLEIDEVDLTVLDIDGQAVDPATLAFPGASAVGDVSRLACPNTGLESSVLNWGSYALSIEGRVGTEVCFRTADPVDVLPSFPDAIQLQRVLVDGQPPAGCEDCSVDADCTNPEFPRCSAGLCLLP